MIQHVGKEVLSKAHGQIASGQARVQFTTKMFYKRIAGTKAVILRRFDIRRQIFLQTKWKWTEKNAMGEKRRRLDVLVSVFEELEEPCLILFAWLEMAEGRQTTTKLFKQIKAHKIIKPNQTNPHQPSQKQSKLQQPRTYALFPALWEDLAHHGAQLCKRSREAQQRAKQPVMLET